MESGPPEVLAFSCAFADGALLAVVRCATGAGALCRGRRCAVAAPRHVGSRRCVVEAMATRVMPVAIADNGGNGVADGGVSADAVRGSGNDNTRRISAG